MKVVPRPTSLSTVSEPPWLSTTIEREMVSPWPVPWPTALVVKKASKMRSRISSGIPAPVSATVMTAEPFSRVVRIRIVPLAPASCDAESEIACAALTIRLRKTWFSSPTLQTTSGSSPYSASMSAAYLYSF